MKAGKGDRDELVELRVEYLSEDDGQALYLSVGFRDDESKYRPMRWTQQ